MNINFLSWFLNVVTSNLSMSRGIIFIMDVNPKEYEVSEHIATKVKVNTWTLSTLKKKKPIEA